MWLGLHGLYAVGRGIDTSQFWIMWRKSRETIVTMIQNKTQNGGSNGLE